MRVESYDMQIAKTCRKCYTIFDYKRDYCCVKDKKTCFADLGLVRKGIKQDQDLAEKLYMKKKIDENRKIIDKKFFGGRLRNECMIFKYRPPGCRSHFCYRWDRYIKEHPRDMVFANLNFVSTRSLLKSLRKEYEYGIKLAYPGGTIIYVSEKDKADGIAKDIGDLMDDMGLKHFRTNAHLMDPMRNSKKGVEIIVDEDGIVGKPRLFGTLLNNNMFMLVKMKMDLGSTGFDHSNIMITTADPEKLADESPASLKFFHAMNAYVL